MAMSLIFFVVAQVMVNKQEGLKREHLRQLEKKLEKCRNQENNPDSET